MAPVGKNNGTCYYFPAVNDSDATYNGKSAFVDRSGLFAFFPCL